METPSLHNMVVVLAIGLGVAGMIPNWPNKYLHGAAIILMGAVMLAPR